MQFCRLGSEPDSCWLTAVQDRLVVSPHITHQQQTSYDDIIMSYLAIKVPPTFLFICDVVLYLSLLLQAGVVSKTWSPQSSKAK